MGDGQCRPAHVTPAAGPRGLRLSLKKQHLCTCQGCCHVIFFEDLWIFCSQSAETPFMLKRPEAKFQFNTWGTISLAQYRFNQRFSIIPSSGPFYLTFPIVSTQPISHSILYLNCPFSLHKPAAQHCLDLPVRQLAVSLLDLPLHRLLQQQSPQTPVEELTRCLPFKDILRKNKRADKPM